MQETFALALGAAAAALTGLIFVAVSVRMDVIARSASLRGRSAEALILFISALLVSLALSVEQPQPLLGAELLLVGLGAGGMLHRLDPAPRPSFSAHLRVAVSPEVVTELFIAAGAVVLLVGPGWGFAPVALGGVAAVALGTFGAWRFLIAAGRSGDAG